MTKVTVNIDNGHIVLEATGHSGHEVDGKDIVCAGVSTLCYSFAELACELAADGEISRNSLIMQEARLKIDVYDKYGQLDKPLRMLSIGLTAWADDYPKNLSVEWGEK